jgi:hypothetical protein
MSTNPRRGSRTRTTPKYEQETVIQRSGDEDVWHVWSTERRMMGQIRRLATRLSLDLKSGSKGGLWVEVQIPAARVRILGPRPEKKHLEGHRREAVLAQLQAARTARLATNGGM